MEAVIQVAGSPHGPAVFEVVVRFPVGSKLMIDAKVVEKGEGESTAGAMSRELLGQPTRARTG